MSEVLSRREAASFLGVSLRTVDRLPISRCKVGRATRFLRADLLAFLDANRIVVTAAPERTGGNVVPLPPPKARKAPTAANANDRYHARLRELRA